MTLNTSPNLVDPDNIYQKLIALHDGRDEDDSMRINARLILLLINHIGDDEVVNQAIAYAAADDDRGH